MQQLRQAPRNLEAERSVVGGLLFHGPAYAAIAGQLKGDDFYDPRHGVTFDAIRELAGRGEPIDLITVAQELRRVGGMTKLEASGGELFLTELANSVGTVEGIAAHARMIRDKRFLRQLILETGRLQERAYADQDTAEAIIESAQANILGLADINPRKEPVILREIVHESIHTLEWRQNNPGAISGVPSGIMELDEITAGAQPGSLVVIAARPGMGKTALTLSWAMHAGEQEYPGLIFSIEMPKEELGMRSLSGLGRVDNTLMRSGLMTKADWFRITKAASLLAKMPIWIDDDGAQDLYSITAKARRWASNRSIHTPSTKQGFVMLDYLQIIKASRQRGQYSSREREVAETSAALKALAKQIKMPVIALSSLNRDCEKRPDKRPLLGDLKESGAIEADADVVMLLYRDEVYNKNPTEKDRNAKPNAGIAEICVAKHRGGPTGTIECQYQKEFTLFRQLSKRPANDAWTPSR